MASVIKDAAAFVLAAAEGLTKGLFTWALVGVVVSYVTIATQGDSAATAFTNDTIISFTSGAVSLLVGFLVSNNINTALTITSTVADIQGLCMELVSLSHALLGDKDGCRDEAKALEKMSIYVLRAVIENIRDSNKLSVDNSIFQGFRSVKKAKEAGVIEATLIGVFSRTLSAIATKYDRLYHLRNIGTPPAIRAIVYVLGVVSVVQYVMNTNGEEDATRVAVGTFVAVATIGVLATSAATRDPLDSVGLSDTLKASVQGTIKEIETLTGMDCEVPANIFSSLRSTKDVVDDTIPTARTRLFSNLDLRM
tara:strand:+ start:6417 stop:7343 length:927 start_codon:yes stop_codon:yes gene_type:complete